MPELPDVAGFKKYLDATSLHRKIASTRCLDERFVKGVAVSTLQRRVTGSELTGSRQWGKWLFASLSRGGHLVMHFGMTGRLDYGKDAGDLPEYTRVALRFEGARRLAILSKRILGQVSYTPDVERFAAGRDLGPDALDVDRDAFLETLDGRSGAVKSALMNQSILAGIGNVYSDEILFQTGVHPETRVNELDAETLEAMHRAMRRILRTAAGKGGDGRKAPRSWLLGGRGADSPCPRCGGKLEKTTVGGRTAWFCPTRQPKP